MKTDNLEKKILEGTIKKRINESIKPDGKQWLPLGIGVYFAVKDAFQGKPHIMGPNTPVMRYASALYHGVVSAYPIYLGVKDLIQDIMHKNVRQNVFVQGLKPRPHSEETTSLASQNCRAILRTLGRHFWHKKTLVFCAESIAFLHAKNPIFIIPIGNILMR